MPNVTLITYTPEPEKIVASAAKLCYSKQGVEGLMDNLTEEKTESFLKMLMSMGHQSPIEHISFTFGIEGVSRSFLAQMTRHRIASYSVQSQRYVPLDHMEYIVPPEIARVPEAMALYEETMAKTQDSYQKLSDILKAKHEKDMIDSGMDPKKAKTAAEKKAIEDARFVLPNACETKMVVTMNARSLLNFFELRCCERAQWEIREVSTMMLREVKKVAPMIFANAGPSCVRGACTEGKMSCGKANEMREFFKSL